METWKIIPNTDYFYEASDLGQIRSFRSNGQKRAKYPRLLKGTITRLGYHSQHIRYRSKRKNRFVHHLVLEAFKMHRPYGFECAHLNGRKTDNRLCNLKWCSKKENQSHRLLHHTDLRGIKHPKSKLTEKQILQIRKKFRPYHYTITDLTKEFGVSYSSIQKIIYGINWKHI